MIVSLLGGAGGALNALHCYLVDRKTFEASIILAGGLHGFILVFLPLLFALFVRHKSRRIQICLIPVIAYLSSWLSWIPIDFSIGAKNNEGQIFYPPWPDFGIHERFIYNLGELGKFLYSIFFGFGLVSVLLYISLTVARQITEKSSSHIFLFSILSGVLGSSVFWLTENNRHIYWYYPMLHGTIWGALVAFGRIMTNKETVN